MIRTIVASLLFVCTACVATTASAQDQKAIDDKILTEYFAKNHIKATKTSSGLYYTINKPGVGPKAKVGQQVSMMYYGYFLDGKRFDGNMDKEYKPAGGPITFALGTGRVISGWDEGIQLLNPGCRATFYLPSGLAYGPNGGGPIPPNAILAFDVELVSYQ